MDIDSEHLGIPKTEYNCTIQVSEYIKYISCGLCGIWPCKQESGCFYSHDATKYCLSVCLSRR